MARCATWSSIPTRKAHAHDLRWLCSPFFAFAQKRTFASCSVCRHKGFRPTTNAAKLNCLSFFPGKGMVEVPGSEKMLEADMILLALGFLGAVRVSLRRAFGNPAAIWVWLTTREAKSIVSSAMT